MPKVAGPIHGGSGGLLVLLMLVACAESTPLAERSVLGGTEIHETPPPAWLDSPSGSKDELCAVGVSGPSYYLEDAVKNSYAQALTELGRAVRVQITSGMDLSVSSSGAEQYQARVTERANLTTDAVVQRAQVRGKWVSPGGYPTRGEKGTVYTLVCVPVTEVRGIP